MKRKRKYTKAVKPKRPPGRPTKKDDGIVELLCKALTECMPLDRACDLVGINRQTVYNWMRDDPVFLAKIRTAKAKSVEWLVNRVKLTDPTGPWKVLKSADPKNFGDEIRFREVEDEKDEEADGMSVKDLEKIAR